MGDALKFLMPLYQSLTKEVISFFRSGNVPRQPQNLSKGSIYPARRPEDGRIDWSKPATEVCNLVRAVTDPYPGAFTHLKMEKIYIWKASISEKSEKSEVQAGSVIGFGVNNQPKIKCGKGVLELINWTTDSSPNRLLRIGDRFS